MAYQINKNAHRPRKVSDKAPMKVRIARFLERQGFYVILLVCLGIVGVTAFLTLSGNGNEAPPQQVQTDTDWPNLVDDPAILDEVVNARPTPTISFAPTPSPTPAPAASPSPEPEDTGEEDVAAIAQDEETMNAASDEVAEPVTEPEPTPKQEASAKLSFAAPVNGALSVNFADTSLIYNKTLKQWTTHPGIDIAAQEGAQVKAVLGGKVESVARDPMLGYKVVIAHDGDRMSVYANLVDDGGLEKGQAVNAGETIGRIGRSAISEIEDEPHLHFEFYQNGKAVDPAPLIDNLSNGMPESE